MLTNLRNEWVRGQWRSTWTGMSVRQYRHDSNFAWVAFPHSRTLLVRREKDWKQGRAVILKVCLILWDLRPHGWETSWLFRWLLLFSHCCLTQIWMTFPLQMLRIPAGVVTMALVHVESWLSGFKNQTWTCLNSVKSAEHCRGGEIWWHKSLK